MKIESNKNFSNGWSWLNSLSLAIICSVFFVGLSFIVFLFINSSNPLFVLNYVSFCITLAMGIFIMVLVVHFFYFNFDLIIRRECVVCHNYVYVNEMSELKDKRGLETVYMCNNHRIVEVK
jgi:hypothetical protein